MGVPSPIREENSHMGLFTFTIAGGGLLLIGAWEALTASSPSSTSTQSSPLKITTQSSKQIAPRSPIYRCLSFVFISILSFFFVVNSIVSLIDARNSKDTVGSTFQLQVVSMGLLFLLYSIMGLLPYFSKSFSLSSSIHELIALFAFVEEFLFFHFRSKDLAGIENRYYDLLLVPIAVCILSTILELKSPNSFFPILSRGIGLILQGTWFLQMGFSFYTDAMVHGCYLHEKSRGNYSVKCKGHMEYHRGRAIATLQFNCHLALIVVLVIVVYTVVARKIGIRGDSLRYRPLREEVQHSQAQFTLDSDEEDNGIEEVESANSKLTVVEMTVKGGSHH